MLHSLCDGASTAALARRGIGRLRQLQRRGPLQRRLVHLVERLRQHGFTLLDTQFVTAHLRQFGVIEIERDEYLRRLNNAVRQKVAF